MAALREVFARFGFEFPDAQKLNKANSDVDKLKAGATALVGVFAGSALVNGIKQFSQELDTLDDLSAQTKIATDDLQVLGFAAELSGSSAAEMNSALTLLQKGLGKTTEATGPQVEALTALGIKLKDAAGAPRELNQVLPEIFAGFGGLKSGAEKAAVATALFGRSGVRLIPTLEKGTAGLADLKDELGEFGGLVDGDTIKSAGEFRDNMARMDRAFFALKGTIASAVFPQLSKLIQGFAKGVGKIADWAKTTTIADTATKALAGTLALTLGKALAPYLGAGLKFGAIFLAVDDLIAFLEGKGSVIGDILTGLFGAEATETIRKTMIAVGEMVVGIGRFVGEGIGAWVNEIANGFPLIKEFFQRLTLDMLQAWHRFVLMLVKAWNKIAPKKLEIDTSGIEKSIADVQGQIDNIGFKAPVPVDQLPVDQGGNNVGEEFGMRVNEDGTPFAHKITRGPKTKEQALERIGFGLPPAAAVPVKGNVASFFGGPVTVNVQAPPGSTARDVAALTGRAVKDATRQSGQALVQRAR